MIGKSIIKSEKAIVAPGEAQKTYCRYATRDPDHMATSAFGRMVPACADAIRLCNCSHSAYDPAHKSASASLGGEDWVGDLKVGAQLALRGDAG